jgi:hypothetical protein
VIICLNDVICRIMLSLNLEEHARVETTKTMLSWYPNSICVIDQIACLWTIWMKVWLCVLTISASAAKLCCVDNFWIGSDLVFVNNFWVSCELCTLMILALVVKLSYVYDFWVGSVIRSKDWCLLSTAGVLK